MVSLSDEQIAFIENDIRIRGITSPELGIDLLDHICCLIERELDEYRNFEAVYQKTLALFGDNGLKEIQDETNRLLIFKHYYRMNSTMKISGYVSSLLILAGAFFKFNHWPGASPLMVLGVFFMTVLFLPLLFILKFRSSAESNRSITLSIIGFVASCLISVGVFFKIMHWPAAQLMIIVGSLLLLLAYLPIYFISVYKNTTNKLNATATVILIIAGVGLIVTATNSSGLPRQTSDSFWRGVTECNDLLVFTKMENKKVAEKKMQLAAADSNVARSEQIENLHRTAGGLLDYTAKMKVFLISRVEEIPEAAAAAQPLDAIRTEGGGAILPELLFGDPHAAFSVVNLKSKIDNYRALVQQINPENDAALLNTGMLNVYGEQVSWEDANFNQLPLPLIIYNITRMELAVATAERCSLDYLQ